MNHRCLVIGPGDRIKAVKNLGWLLRHWRDVSSLEIRHFPGEEGNLRGARVLAAQLRDGREYNAVFEDRSVLLRWLDRPVFRGVSRTWCKEQLALDALMSAQRGAGE